MKCVLFDLDGTLVSTGGAGNRALDRAFAGIFNLQDSMRDVDPAGKTDPAIIREIFVQRLERHPLPAEIEKIQNQYLQFLGEECQQAKGYSVMEGIPELLSILKEKNVAMGLGTGNLEPGARIKLERAGLNHFLPFGGYGSDSEDRGELLCVGRKKAELHLGRALHSHHVFVVGDTERDILAARQANLKVVAVATGQRDAQTLQSYQPDFVFENFKNIHAFVDLILSA